MKTLPLVLKDLFKVNTFFFLFLISTYQTSIAQYQVMNWYFGGYAGVHFNSNGSLSTLTDGVMNTYTGCATVSSVNGSTLFYTAGDTIWDNTHTPMGNGKGLLKDDLTQPVIVIPNPDTANIFFVFTLASNNIYYSVVDMRLNSNYGNVVAGRKNISLLNSGGLRISAVKHENRKDYWVVILRKDSSMISSFLVTSNGVSAKPVNSKLTNPYLFFGELKLSPDGRKLGFTCAYNGFGLMADFDNANGKVSNEWTVPLFQPYGVEFSSTSNYLYISDPNKYRIYQYDVNATSESAFRASRKTIDSTYNSYNARPHGLQLGPNGKIYVACPDENFLSVINAPDSTGFKCRSQKRVISLGNYDHWCNISLPNFVQSIFQRRIINYTRNCLKDSTFFSIVGISISDSVIWNFGDASSGPNNISRKKTGVFHVYDKPGTYQVSLFSFYKNFKDTVRLSVKIKDPKPYLGRDTAICNKFTYALKPKLDYLTYKWNNDSTRKISYITQKGTYILKVKDSVGCLSADTIIIKNPKNAAGFKLSDTMMCLHFNKFNIKDTSFYKEDKWKKSTWYFSDGTNDQDTLVKKTFKDTGSFTIKLVLNTGEGCKDSTTQKIRILPSVDINFNINKDKQCFKGHSFNFTNTSKIASGSITNYYWQFGDDSSSTLKNISGKKYGKDSTYKVQLITRSNLNCTDTLKKTISVFPDPQPGFSISKPAQCYRNNSMDINNSSRIKSGSISSYKWNLGDNTFSSQTNITNKSYSTPDSFIISLLTISDNGCRDSINKIIQIFHNSNSSFTVNNINQCFNGHSFKFTNTSYVNKGKIAAYYWILGDDSSSSNKDIQNKKYLKDSAYVVKMITITDKNCYDTAVMKVAVFPNARTNFTASRTVQCLKNNQVDFINSSTLRTGSIASYRWDLGDSSIIHQKDATSKVYDRPDSFKVNLLTITDKGCRDSLFKIIKIFPSPQIKYRILNDSQCWQKYYSGIVNETTIKYGKMSHQWDFGDGTYDNNYDPKPQKYGNKSAQYNIWYKAVSDHGCSDSLNHLIHILEKPVSKFEVNDSEQCFRGHQFSFKNKTSFSDTNTLTYDWDYGNGSSSTGAYPKTATYAQAGKYAVRLISHSSLTDCYDTVVYNLLVDPNSHPEFISNKDSQCLGNNTYIFSNLSTLSSGSMLYKWDFGDGSQSTDKNPVKLYQKTGDYHIKLTVTTNYLCTDSIEETVTVVPHPKAEFNINDTSQCLNQHNFDCSNITTLVYGTYFSKWTFDDIDPVFSKNVNSKKFLSGGKHKITLIMNSLLNCADTISKWVYLEEHRNTKILLAGKDSQCLNGNIFTWSAKSADPFITYNAYNWDFGDGKGSAGNKQSHTYSKSGNMSVLLETTSTNGCKDTGLYNVVVHSHPISSFIANNVCFPETVKFKNTSVSTDGNIKGYYWDFGDGSNSTLKDFNKYYSIFGNYKITLVTVSEYGCSDTFKSGNLIQVWKKPIAKFDFTTLPSKEFGLTSLQMNNQSSQDVLLYNWDFGNGVKSSDKDPVIDYHDSGNQWIILEVSNDKNCKDTFRFPTGKMITDFFLQLPNSFSPDGNGVNDEFKPVANPYVRYYIMEIFNRWGQKVFETRDINQGWDGTYMGETCEQDIYTCRIYVVPMKGKLQSHKLTITLLR